MTKNYPHIGRKEEELNAEFWEKRYRTGETGWDQGEPSPGLLDFFSEETYKPGFILVPGCGRGHDALALAKAGYKVVGVDISTTALEEARRLAQADGLQIQFEQADFFNLPDSLRGPYDSIFEHTFFCAIDPAHRDRYVETVAGLLKKNGLLIGVFFNIQPETGPPFGTTREELLDRFRPFFRLVFERVPPSLPDREGQELLMFWQKK
jgi:SAM-dependent methyltransferase